MSIRTLVHAAKRAPWRARTCGHELVRRLQRRLARQKNGVRILTYHGVCRDDQEKLPWIPHYFVTEQRLADHLEWLRQAGEVVSLREALALLREGKPRDALVYCVTFDDGYYNNLSLAAPILAAHDVPATIFLTTGYVECGGEVPMWLQGRFLQHFASSGRLSFPEDGEESDVIQSAVRWGRLCPFELAPKLAPLWREAEDLVERADLDATRALTCDEVRRLADYGVDLGAHTVTHPFLSRLDPERRRSEIEQSVEFVRSISGKREVAFAYPNGKPRDFGQFDIDVLRELGVIGAVTTTPGVNFPSEEFDAFRLHRLPVSRRKTRDDFLAMLSGLYDHNSLWQPPD